jgi:hypothetical protein
MTHGNEISSSKWMRDRNEKEEGVLEMKTK